MNRLEPSCSGFRRQLVKCLRVKYSIVAALVFWLGGASLAWAAPGVAVAENNAVLEQRAALRQRLAAIDVMVRDLKQSSQHNIEAAVAEQKQCLDQVKDFDRKLGDVYRQRDEYDKRGDELRVSLARTAEQQKNSAAEVAKLRNDVEKAKASLSQLEHNFELLRKWWWVPGYGQYLAVKTLVDGEITQHRSLLDELNHKNSAMANQDALVLGARKMMCEIAEERESIDGAAEALKCVHDIVRTKGEEFRVKTIALTDREEFWQRTNDMGSITVDGKRRVLVDLLTLQSSSQLDGVVAKQVEKLELALSDYAKQLEAGHRFIEATPDGYCMNEEAGNQCGVPVKKATSSFQFSCTDIKIGSEADTLVAQCKKFDGRLQATSIKLRGIHNINGVLVQDAQNVSSFQRSCANVFVCGTSLMASCRKANGTYADSTIKISRVHNSNGTLVY